LLSPPFSPTSAVSASETLIPMRIQAAVVRQPGLPPPYAESKPLEVIELDLSPPGRDVAFEMAGSVPTLELAYAAPAAA
jgi:hypothetical protein